MKNKITAVIPVKGSSSRLPGKNFLPFGKSNSLLEHKIKTLKRVPGVEKIVVNSDSLVAEQISKNQGVEFKLRPDYYANETRPLSEFFRYVAETLDTEHMLWACVTSPLIDEIDFNNAIEIYNKAVINGSNDSLITVCDFQHYLMNENGPLNYEVGEKHLNSDQLEKLHLFTNGILICSKENLIKWGYNYGPKAYRLKVPQEKSIDIDTKWDYLTALAWEKELRK